MDYIYAYEVMSFALLIILAVTFSKNNWLFLYKNFIYGCIQYATILILFIDFTERAVNRHFNGDFTIFNIVFADIAYISALILMVLFDIYYISYTDGLSIIKQKKFIIFTAPVIITTFLVLTNNYTHIFFWFDNDGVFHYGKYTWLYVICIIFYVLSGIYTVFTNRQKFSLKVRVLLYLSAIILGVCIFVQFTMINRYLITYYGVTLLITVLYLTMHNSESYMVHSSGCFSLAGFDKVVKERMIYHKNFCCLAICLCNIESISDYCIEDEVNMIQERIGEILRKIGGRHNVYHIHSDEYMIMTDSKNVEEVYREVREKLPGMIRINDKNVSLFYRYFVADGEDAGYDFADYSRIIISMKKMAVDTNNDKIMLTYEGSVRETIKRELSAIRKINEAIGTGKIEVDSMPVFDLKENGKFTRVEIKPRLILEDGYNLPVEEFWSLSREIGCGKDANMVFLKSALQLAANLKLFENGIEYISINVSPYHIVSENICNENVSMIRDYEISPERIVFELMIDSSISDEIMQHSIECLRGYGIKVCWDNFGMDACNLNDIVNMPFDEVKISHELVALFYHGKTRQLIYIIKMLKRNDWLVSFDGLGDETGLSKAKELGVRYVQKSDLEEYMTEDELREFLLKKGGISDVI